MDASERGALMLVRFVAIALILFSLALLATPLTAAVNTKSAIDTAGCLLRALPALVAVIMLIKARAIAQWLSDLLDG